MSENLSGAVVWNTDLSRKLAAHFLSVHRNLGDLALIHVGLELREAQFLIALSLRTLLEKPSTRARRKPTPYLPQKTLPSWLSNSTHDS